MLAWFERVSTYTAKAGFAGLQDLHGMIDAAKYADLVLLMVDGGFGFEMETFEFLNLLQVSHTQLISTCSNAAQLLQGLCRSSSRLLPSAAVQT